MYKRNRMIKISLGTWLKSCTLCLVFVLGRIEKIWYDEIRKRHGGTEK